LSEENLDKKPAAMQVFIAFTFQQLSIPPFQGYVPSCIIYTWPWQAGLLIIAPSGLCF
jgi:hypothetical protein